MTDVITPPLFTFVFKVLTLSSWCWKPRRWPERRAIYYIDNDVRSRAAPGCVPFSSALSHFPQGSSGGERVPPLKDACLPAKQVSEHGFLTLLIPADKGLHALEKQRGSSWGDSQEGHLHIESTGQTVLSHSQARPRRRPSW